MPKNKGRSVEKAEKKKMTKYEKRKIMTKIFTWIVALIMIFGSLISIFGMLLYY